MKYFRLIKPIKYLALNAGEPYGAIFGLDDNNHVYLMDKEITWLHYSIFSLSPDAFKEIVVKYKIGDKVKAVNHAKDKYGEIISISPFENKMTVRYDDLRHTEEFSLNSALVKKCYTYWFYNSKGKICSITEDKTEPEALRYRKEIGNYFASPEEAKNHKVVVVKK